MPELKKSVAQKVIRAFDLARRVFKSQSDDSRDVGHIRIVRDLHVPFGSLSTLGCCIVEQADGMRRAWDSRLLLMLCCKPCKILEAHVYT